MCLRRLEVGGEWRKTGCIIKKKTKIGNISCKELKAESENGTSIKAINTLLFLIYLFLFPTWFNDKLYYNVENNHDINKSFSASFFFLFSFFFTTIYFLYFACYRCRCEICVCLRICMKEILERNQLFKSFRLLLPEEGKNIFRNS